MSITVPSIGGTPSWELQITTALLTISWILLLCVSIYIAKRNKQYNWMWFLILHALFGLFLFPIEAGLVIPTVYVLFFQKKN